MFTNLTTRHNRRVLGLHNVIFAMTLLLGGTASAEMVSVNGYATIGVVSAQHETLRFRSSMLNRTAGDWSLSTDTVIGGQVNLTFNDQWDAVGQIVLQDRANRKPSNYIEKAFIRYRPNRNLAIRGGRLDSNFYLLSDYRTVGYAYPWARPPIDFYSGVAVAAVTDGVDLQYTRDIWNGFLKIGLLYGNAPANLASESGEKTEFDFSHLCSLTAEYQRNSWLFKATIARAELSNFAYQNFDSFLDALRSVPSSLWPKAIQIAESFDPQGDTARFLGAGFRYDDDAWQFQAEFGTFAADNWRNLPDASFGYFSVGYYVGEWMPYVVVAAHRPDQKYIPIDIPQLPPGLPAQLVTDIQLLAIGADESARNTFVDQNSISIGARWDFTDSWAFKLQFDHYRIQGPGSALFGNNAQNLVVKPKPLNVFHLGLSTIF